jgi:hypothetical protein
MLYTIVRILQNQDSYESEFEAKHEENKSNFQLLTKCVCAHCMVSRSFFLNWSSKQGTGSLVGGKSLVLNEVSRITLTGTIVFRLHNVIQTFTKYLPQLVCPYAVLQRKKSHEKGVYDKLTAGERDVHLCYICQTLINIFRCISDYRKSRDSAVGIATGYGLDDREVGVRVQAGSSIFSSPRRPDRLWGPPNLLSNGYWGLFSRG